MPQTFAANDLNVFLNGLRALGYDSHALLAAAGLAEDDLLNPDRRISCQAYGVVLAQAQQTRFTPNLALELARVTPLGSWPLLDYLVLTADTVGTGIHQLARYFRLTGNPVALAVHDEENPVRVEMTTAIQPFAIEFVVALLHLHFRVETEGRFHSAAIFFQHEPDDSSRYRQLLGVPVTTRASWSGVEISSDTWQVPLRRRDPILRQMLERQADEMLAQLPKDDDLVAHVQRTLLARIMNGDLRVQSVARHLHMSPRTLQRRLNDEGVTFQKLVDETRREAASRYLRTRDLAIGEVAYLVGFSEPAPFYRAFRRWFGTTPEQFRQRT